MVQSATYRHACRRRTGSRGCDAVADLRGTPTIYYGDEIGMEQVAIAKEDVCDPFERNVPGIGVGRDGCRTPMQWDAGENSGFSNVEPWLPLADGWRKNNVAYLRNEPLSIWNLYRRLLQVRRKTPALSVGFYRSVRVDK